jgi:hypothetical protein
MVEGTIAGLAAGLVANGDVDAARVSHASKSLEIYQEGKLIDVALVDVVLTTDLFIGSRALWDPSKIREIVLARAEPGSIGMSAIGSQLQLIGPYDDLGMHLQLGSEGTRVLAPVAPGLITRVCVAHQQLLSVGDEVVLEALPSTVALDGERTLRGFPERPMRVRLTSNGPRVVDIDACMREGIETGAFRRRCLVDSP